jgi:Zn-dependent alcohol dehydrogenase
VDAAAADGTAEVAAADDGAADAATDGAADGATDGAVDAAADGRAEAAAAAEGAALAGTVVLVGVAPPQAAKRMAAAPLAKPPSNVRREMTLPDTSPATVPSLSLRSAICA